MPSSRSSGSAPAGSDKDPATRPPAKVDESSRAELRTRMCVAEFKYRGNSAVGAVGIAHGRHDPLNLSAGLIHRR